MAHALSRLTLSPLIGGLFLLMCCLAAGSALAETIPEPDIPAEETIVVYGRVITPSPVPDDIEDPYANAFIFHRFEVLYVESGSYQPPYLLASFWIKKDYEVQKNAMLAINDVVKMTLTPLSRMESFDRFYEETQRVDTTGDYESEPYWVLEYEKVEGVALNEIDIARNVVIGDNGWLYLARSMRERPFSQPTMQKLAENLESINQWLTAKDIRFLITVAPNKIHIHPENAPADIQAQAAAEGGRLDTFLSYMAANTTVEVLDLRTALQKAAPQAAQSGDHLYFKTDNHWNSFGAYTGYTAIMERLATWYPSLKTLPLDSFMQKRKVMEGYLTSFLGLKSIIKEPFTFYDRLNAKAPKPEGPTPTVLLIEDSFAVYLKPFLQGSFPTMQSLYTRGVVFNDSLLRKYKPEIVIIEQGEIFLNRLKDHKPPVTP